MTIPTLPPAPNSNDPGNFADEMDDFLAALPNFVSAVNAEGAALTGIISGGTTSLNLIVSSGTSSLNAIVSTGSTTLSGIVTGGLASLNAKIAEGQTALDLKISTGLASLDAKLATAGFTATSTTSNVVELGTKTWTVQTNRAFAPGMYLIIADSAAPSVNYMVGQVTAYNAGTGALTVFIVAFFGSGTKTAWTFSLSAPTTYLFATKEEIWSGASAGKVTSPKIWQDAQAFVDLGDVSGTITLDLKAGINFKLRLVGNATLADPTNKWDGSVGIVSVTQDATGGRTLALASAIKKAASFTLSTPAGATDAFTLWCEGSVAKISPLLKAFA